MPLSVIDLYRDILPRTNCRDCGFPTCLAFASMVVSEKLPLGRCPHLAPEVVAAAQRELDAQHAAGQWTRRDVAQDALLWARRRASSMDLADAARRVGGDLEGEGARRALRLPYFGGWVRILPDRIENHRGEPLERLEQVLIYNHLAQGGVRLPTGRWRAFHELPNTVSKVKSMRAHVEAPLAERFQGRREMLRSAARAMGGEAYAAGGHSADEACRFDALPRVPVLLLFWEGEPAEDLAAEVKLLFDETVGEHLDIESILFLGERICRGLCAISRN
jgi:hypothetical protein